MNEQSTLLSKTDVARILQTTSRTVNRYMARGEIRYVKMGTLVRFHREDVECFLRERTVLKCKESGSIMEQNNGYEQ